ncbi:MAG: transposase [Gammaproteobacteria bacterium]|nr:transposase [Gammaproteobacteria bacterium]
MTRARYCQIDLAETTFYHVINRCVRRSYLCGKDRYSGKNFEHRRQWVIKRIKHLAKIYSIEIGAYAIMSNHYHLVLNVNIQNANSWSMDEVIKRWRNLYKGHVVVDKYLAGIELSAAEIKLVNDLTLVWRKRLYDISWFMKSLNEFIARQSNKEDKCTGKFWEGRFKSQALLDNTALLSCLAYVDLNPIRAGICDSLEGSDFTSIQERLIQQHAYTKLINRNSQNSEFSVPNQPPSLMPFITKHCKSNLPFDLDSYLQLVQWSKSNLVNNDVTVSVIESSTLFVELGLDAELWLEAVKNFRRHYGSWAGSQNILKRFAQSHGQRWCKGTG